MKFLSFKVGADDQPRLGVMLEAGNVLDISAVRLALPDAQAAKVPASMKALIEGGAEAIGVLETLLSDSTLHKHVVAADTLTFLAPITPSKNVFCVGRNYREHIIEGNIASGRPADSFPEAIEFFTKPPTAVVGHGASVSRHAALTKSLDYEVELAIVIGKRGVNISEAQALDHVFGYTVVNDITARDLQKRHGQWFKGKGLDGTCPMGPVIVHHSAIANPNALQLSLDVNGEQRQNASTDEMIFTVQAVIAQLSAGMTLEPGDVISTGTPKGVGYAAKPPRCLEVGDVVTARVEGIGELVSTIVV